MSYRDSIIVCGRYQVYYFSSIRDVGKGGGDQDRDGSRNGILADILHKSER